MVSYDFSHGVRFLWNDREYSVRANTLNDVTIEDLRYGTVQTIFLKDLLSEWEQGNLVFPAKNDKGLETVKEHIMQFTEEELREIDRRFEIIKPFIRGNGPSTVDEYLETLAPPRPSRSNFFRWLRLYREHEDKRVLAPRYDKRGPKTRRVHLEVMKQIRAIMESTFYKGPDSTTHGVFVALQGWAKNYNQFRRDEDKINLPSRRTIYRVVNELVDRHRQEASRVGKVQSDLDKRGSRGTVVVDRPLERVEIDWTPCDILTVDTGTQKRERWWLILAADKLGMPLGFHITFRPPTAKDLKECLLHAMLPKTYVRNLFPEVNNDWIAWGKPEEIVVDNAKVNESGDLEDVLRICEIDIQYCNVESGYQKGTVEKMLGDINRILHRYAGTTFSNAQERGQYESEEKACLTIRDLQKMLHVIIVDELSGTIHEGYGLTPRQVWEKGLQMAGVHRKLARSPRDLKIMFSSGLEYRAITNKGVEISGQHYQSDALMQLRHRRQQQGIQDDVKIRFNDPDMRRVYVYDDEMDLFIEAYASDSSLERKGIDPDYPVHHQQLADHEYGLNHAKEVFDYSDLTKAHETLAGIVKQAQANLRRLKRNYQDSTKIPSVKPLPVLAHQLEAMGLEPVQDIETLSNVREISPEELRASELQKRKKYRDKTPNHNIPENVPAVSQYEPEPESSLPERRNPLKVIYLTKPQRSESGEQE